MEPNITTGMRRFFKRWGFTRCGNNESPFTWSGAAYCAIIKGVAFWCPFNKYGELQGAWVLGKDFMFCDIGPQNMRTFILKNT